MTESSTATTAGASAESLIRYAIPNDVYAARTSGGSITIEEYPAGSIIEAAKRADDRDRRDGDAALVICLTGDAVGGDPNDTFHVHPDQDDRLEVIARAREALDAAEAALLAVGYMDNAHLRESDYRTVQQRERHAFDLGRDSVR